MLPMSSDDTLEDRTKLNYAGSDHEVRDEDDEDPETAELSQLRCGSVRTEELSQQRSRQNATNRCADYPGLAFGSAMFGSDTMMKFNIIENELHNIMKSQMKRIDGEVAAFAQRIKKLDDDLTQSEQYIKTATASLAEVVRLQQDEDLVEENSSSALSRFDAQLALLEGQLLQAKELAAETHKTSRPSAPRSTPGANCLLSAPAVAAPSPLRRPFKQ